MSTVRPSVRTRSARHPSATTLDPAAEHCTIEDWDDDIVRASLAVVRQRGLNTIFHSAEDVAQDVRLAVILAFRKTGITGERYVRRVISNSAKNSVRRTRVVALPISGDALDSNVGFTPKALREEPAVRDVLAEHCIQKWLRHLPRPLKNAFFLLYCENLTQLEAAERLGVSQPRISKIHRRLVERGREELRALFV